MQQLQQKISIKLIEYQREVDLKLREFYKEGLISKRDIEELRTDVELTGKAVLQTFESENDYPENVLKIYIDNLFGKYKSEVEAKIAAIERKKIKDYQDEKYLKYENEKQTNQNIKKDFLGQVINWLGRIGKQSDYAVKKRNND